MKICSDFDASCPADGPFQRTVRNAPTKLTISREDPNFKDTASFLVKDRAQPFKQQFASQADMSNSPIRRLRDATEKSIAPPGYTPDDGSVRSDISGDELAEMENGTNGSIPSKKGLFVRLRNLTPGSRRKTAGQRSEDERRRVFKIPGKVADRKHWINDELTDLTTTFNSMSDELMLQYSSLEERVATRTEELEVAKKAAEAANESKTVR